MRRLLRDVAEGRALGDTTTLADPAVVEMLKEQYGDEDWHRRQSSQLGELHQAVSVTERAFINAQKSRCLYATGRGFFVLCWPPGNGIKHFCRR